MSEQRGGLEGVVAAKTELSFIDGKEGVLRYRGYDIHDLAENASFEEVVYLLWNGDLPTASELATFKADLARERPLDPGVVEFLRGVGPKANPMQLLRTAVSDLSMFDPTAEADDEAGNKAKATRLVAKFPTIVAAYDRIRRGEEPVDPDPELGHAANFLYMLTGERPSETAARAMDTALVLHADHGFNASTFSARITASTLSDIYSAVTSAVGTLKGPLHGGANQRVMEMLLEIGEPSEAEGYVKRKLANRERIMGFGHRVYKTMDPRAVVLRRMSEEMGEDAGKPKWFDISERIRESMQAEKGLDPNVDFYSASVYHTMGIPTDLFTPIFAISRVSGWTAHVLEQYRNNRLIRPRGEYVGPGRREWVPLDARA